MAADVEEAQNENTVGAVSGDGVNDVMVEADQLSAVDAGTDESPVVEDSAAPAVVDENASDDDDDEDDEDYLVEEGEIAGDYLEQLLDVLDFDGDIDLDVEGDRAIVSIDGGDDLAKLVGRKGEVLDALQELTRLAVQQSTGERSKLMLDVAGWRAKRRSELGNLGTEAARRVLESGDREELTPMTPFERKIVHDAVAKIDGVASESTGVEPARRVVVVKA
ncbi:single-stranded DNA-binding protein [Rhodococcus sp. 06-235-1A]|uniref:Jag family protein n=1 Tax=Rhodococcus sp. 06-235-1A TaxID=2022508 RepID=UPI000B9B2B88|nr:protein jag [Rhodococcus sp. 06-235-1A]OZD07083.1 single-stranded DNA-binding protein [Rhodococcus sp. 06-235-1A]